MKPQCCLLVAIAVLIAAGARGPAAEPGPVTIQVEKDHIDFKAGDALVGRYHTGPEIYKPYMWPLHGPGGVPITRAWPMVKAKEGESTDHVHQKSLWFCHGDVIPEGIALKDKVNNVEGVDFWSEHANAGRIVCVKVGKPQATTGAGTRSGAFVSTSNEWRGQDGTKILDEERTIGLYDYGDTRLLVFEIALHASVCPITFGDTKEGSMGVRVNDVLREKGGNGGMVNAEGKKGMKEIWGYKSVWCDYSGEIDNRKVGIAIFDDPGNRSPAYWHSRDYGLMAANPFGRAKSGFPAVKGSTDLVKLGKGDHLRLRYGVLIHPGDAKEGKVGEYFEKFVKLREK